MSDMSDLPDVIPVFPLPNVVLFPNVQLPLHIFEQRYRAMVRDASGNTPSLIGMVLLRGDSWQDEYEGNPAVYPIGCVGEMARMVPMPDGRSNILLKGVREFEIQDEISTESYRQARVTWRPVHTGVLPDGQQQELRGLLERYLPQNENVEKFLADPAIDDEFFVNFFSFHLDLLPLEKQSLLEAATLPERATCLRDILDFKLTEANLSKSPSDKSRLH
jgi:Lon protease-like protein